MSRFWSAGLRLSAFAALLFSALIPVRATVVVPPPFEKLVNESDFIVRAKVRFVTAAFAPDGGRKIVTQVGLDVAEVIAGNPPEPLVLRMLGGKVGPHEMVIEGAPQFTVGEEAVFFVRGNGSLAYPLVAIMHGLYPIEHEAASGREIVTRSDRMPLQSTAEVSQPLQEKAAPAARQAAATRALSPDQFAAQIRSAVRPDNSRLHEK